MAIYPLRKIDRRSPHITHEMIAAAVREFQRRGGQIKHVQVEPMLRTPEAWPRGYSPTTMMEDVPC